MKLTKYVIDDIENRIGYKFQNTDFLELALTHSSYANEKKKKKIECNERIEFLGDAVLELISSEFLYNKYPNVDEGELTKTRAGIVCEPTLYNCAKEFELGKFVLLGKGEFSTGGSDRPSILSDALESLIGAIYLDGGFDNAKKFVEKFILNDLEDKKLFYDGKTILQEIVQGKRLGSLKYELIDESGPDHNKLFTVAVIINDEILEKGLGKSKKLAEQEAAYKAILKLKKENNI